MRLLRSTVERLLSAVQTPHLMLFGGDKFMGEALLSSFTQHLVDERDIDLCALVSTHGGLQFSLHFGHTNRGWGRSKGCRL